MSMNVRAAKLRGMLGSSAKKKVKKKKKYYNMERYIGTKIILAEPETIVVSGRENQVGYKVVYEDGYTSWSPKDAFERAYRRITNAELSLLK